MPPKKKNETQEYIEFVNEVVNNEIGDTVLVKIGKVGMLAPVSTTGYIVFTEGHYPRGKWGQENCSDIKKDDDF